MFKRMITVMLVIIFTFISIPKPIESEPIPVNTQIDVKPEIQLESESVNKPIIKEENKYIVMRATAYTKSKEEGTSKGITKSGTLVSRGTVAVDPKLIPLGTKLYIEGYGHAVAHDTGGLIKGNRLDIWLPTKELCFNWGRRTLQVIIFKD